MEAIDREERLSRSAWATRSLAADERSPVSPPEEMRVMARSHSSIAGVPPPCQLADCVRTSRVVPDRGLGRGRLLQLCAAGVVVSMNACSVRVNRSGSSTCGKCPDPSKISSWLAAIWRWARRPCSTGMIRSWSPHMRRHGTSFIRCRRSDALTRCPRWSMMPRNVRTNEHGSRRGRAWRSRGPTRASQGSGECRPRLPDGRSSCRLR